MNVSLDGHTTFRRALPPEQDFESLAARIRPLVLKDEPIHYPKVLAAVTSLVRAKNEAQAAELARTHVKDLKGQWQSVDIEKPDLVQGYWYQSKNTATGEVTPRVTDTQLAAAWLYGDLVHANPKPRIQAAMAYPLKERYAAAVGVFSRLALLTLRTKKLIQDLVDEDCFKLSATTWSEPVSVPNDELVDEGVSYLAPVGTPDPEDISDLPAEWAVLDVPDLMAEQDPTRRGVVRLIKDGVAVDEYEAVTIRRALNGSHGDVDILVAKGVVFHLSLDLGEDGTARTTQITMTRHPTTNSTRLHIERFVLALQQTGTAILELNGHPLGSMTDHSSQDDIQQTRQLVDILTDLVKVETLLGRELPMLDENVLNRQHLELRILRLVLEGNLVATNRRSVQVTSDTGAAPQVVVLSPGTFKFGNLQIPRPQLYMGHPQITSRIISDNDEHQDREPLTFEVSAPKNELFLVWDPQRVSVRPDFLGVAVVLWRLEGVSEGMAATK